MAIDVPEPMLVQINWSTGLIEVLARNPVEDDMEPGGGYCLCVRSHPALLRSAMSRSLRSEMAFIVAALVDDFWSALVRRHEALIELGMLAVHARGGPRPVDGFRRMPPDIWAASTVDWAAGTCTTPDGHVYFSVHVAPPEQPKPRATESSETIIVRAEPKLIARQPTASTDGMDVHAASRFLGVSKSSLDKWRLDGSGPPFHKIGSRVRYLEPDLDAWRNRRRSSGRPS
ncbi:helix-turn-helix transcriptional regulator [Methylobacterium sp. D53M]